MEKLELKHIVGYLPYNVVVFVNDCKNKKTKAIHRLHVNQGIGNINHVLTSERYKICLRPLSDLTKEIEVNGEKFVPIDYNAFKHSKSDIIEFQNKFIHYKGMKFGIIERLLEWHFDIYGLIEKGLAIDINTLK